MIKFNPDNKDTLTYGEALKPAIEIREKEEAQQYLRDYATFIQKYLDVQPDPQGRTAVEIAKINIGYFAGYYNSETSRRAQELFETEHPIFGKSDPSPENALGAGIKMAKEGKGFQRLSWKRVDRSSWDEKGRSAMKLWYFECPICGGKDNPMDSVAKPYCSSCGARLGQPKGCPKKGEKEGETTA